MPANVFNDPQPPQGAQDSLLLQLPLLSRPADPSAQPVQVLLVAPFTSDPKDRARQVRETVALAASVAAMPELDRRDQPMTPVAHRVADAPDGLVQVAANPSDAISSDVFVRPPLTGTAEYVACNRLGGMHGHITSPVCQQEFVGPGITVKATGPCAELPKWNQIRQTILSYLQAHRTA